MVLYVNTVQHGMLQDAAAPCVCHFRYLLTIFRVLLLHERGLIQISTTFCLMFQLRTFDNIHIKTDNNVRLKLVWKGFPSTQDNLVRLLLSFLFKPA